MNLALAKNETGRAVSDSFAVARDRLPGTGKVAEARSAAFEAYDRVGLPHRRIEDWKYTDLRALMREVLPLAPAPDAAALKRAARASNLSLSQLRGNVTSTTIVQAGQTKGTSPLVQISVQAPAKAKSAKAANSLARTVIGVVAPYVDEKIALLQQQIDNNERQLEEVDRRIAIATQQQNLALAKNSPLSLTEKLLVSTNSNATINSAEGRRASIQSDLTSGRQLLSLAENVERSRVVVPAVASKTSAVSRRTAAVVGGLIGLLLGALAAVLADPWLQRRSAAEA